MFWLIANLVGAGGRMEVGNLFRTTDAVWEGPPEAEGTGIAVMVIGLGIPGMGIGVGCMFPGICPKTGGCCWFCE